MSLVVNPYSYFTDTNGNALNGYLYVGEVGKNAENYPIAIFYDNLFTTPAPNPLTISAGYIYNSGTIAQIYASVDYSIVVKKTDGSLVYSSLNETGMTNEAIANVDEMKHFVAPYNNYALNVLGYSEDGDGGGGLFYYDATSTEDDNGGTIIEPISGSGRWIRVCDFVKLEYFGVESPDYVLDSNWTWDATIDKSTANLGTIIDPSVALDAQGTGSGLGCMVRQYSGAVNVKWFGANATMLDNLSSITYAFNTFNSCILPDEILKVSNGLKIKPLSTIKSNRAISTSYIGDTYNAYAGIKKTTNNTTTITNFETGVSSNIDCIAYIDPYWIDGGSFYPQGISLKDISFSGNTTKNAVGLYIEQGGNFNFENLSFSNTINSIWMKEAWMTSLKKITGDGVFVHRGGTSTTLDNCWFKNGYSVNSLIYSSFNNCASDGASNIAYTFTNSKVVLNGCGCEGASTIESDRGTAISFNGGNNIEVNNFVCVPRNNQTSPIYSFGHNDYVVFNGGSSHYASNVTGADAHVWYAGATIIFNNYTFANGTQDNPVITFKPEAQYGSKVIVNYGANTKIYYCDNNGNTLVDDGGYKNVTSGRVAEVTYTNTKGTPLNVSVSIGLTSRTTPTYIYVNGSPQQILWNPDGQGIFTCSFVVPNNGTYSVSSGNPFINLWMESI